MCPPLHRMDTQPVYIVDAQRLLLHLNPPFQTLRANERLVQTISFYFSVKDCVQQNEVRATVGNLLVFRNIFFSRVNERALMQQSLHLRGCGHTIEAFDFSYKLVRCSSHRHSGDALRSWTPQQPGPQHITVEVKGVGPGGVGMEKQKEARRNSAKGYSYL